MLLFDEVVGVCSVDSVIRDEQSTDLSFSRSLRAGLLLNHSFHHKYRLDFLNHLGQIFGDRLPDDIQIDVKTHMDKARDYRCDACGKTARESLDPL